LNHKEPAFIQHLTDLSSGSRNAFRHIFDECSGQIYHFALQYVNSAFDAEEITQEVFVRLWETRHRIDPGANFDAYLFTITRNIIFNSHKKKLNEWKYYDKVKSYVLNNSIDTDTVVLYNELESIIQKYIDAMPEKRRKVFVLNRFQGLSHKQIAEELNISTKTVEVHMRLALKELKGSILRDYKDEKVLLLLYFIS